MMLSLVDSKKGCELTAKLSISIQEINLFVQCNPGSSFSFRNQKHTLSHMRRS